MASETQSRRPWTVYVLTLLAVAGLVWALSTGGVPGVWEIANLVFGSWVAYSIWVGRRWAFTLMFMLVSLCAVLAGGIGLVQPFLLEQSVHPGVWPALGGSALWIVLLLHPSTKRFAGVEEASARPAQWTARTGG